MLLIDIANVSTRSHRSEFKCFGFIQKNRFPFCFRSHKVRYRSYRYKSTVSESVFNDLITNDRRFSQIRRPVVLERWYSVREFAIIYVSTTVPHQTINKITKQIQILLSLNHYTLTHYKIYWKSIK